MTDLARLEKLCGNLNHALVDVRLRAVQNLQFKLLSGVLGEGVYTSVSCMRSLSDGISASLQSLIAAGNEWQSPTSSACKLMEELLQLSHTIGLKAGLAPEAVHESLAVLLEKLYTISGKCGNADPMHRLAQKVGSNFKNRLNMKTNFFDDYSFSLVPNCLPYPILRPSRASARSRRRPST